MAEAWISGHASAWERGALATFAVTESGGDLVGAAGLRNLIAHQYGAVDWGRLHAIASSPELDDLEAFCAALAAKLR